MWTGAPGARYLVGVFLVLAAVAMWISGSLLQAIIALSASGRGEFNDSIKTLLDAFLNDITGTPGLLVTATKTVFAVGVAFLARKVIKNLRGEMEVEVSSLKLSGTQSGLIVWCAVFALVKLL